MLRRSMFLGTMKWGGVTLAAIIAVAWTTACWRWYWLLPKKGGMWSLLQGRLVVVRPGTEIGEFVSNIDTFASVLGMLDVPAPPDYRHEGKDFSPLLHARKLDWRDAVFAQYDLHNSGKARMRSIRTDRWQGS